MNFNPNKRGEKKIWMKSIVEPSPRMIWKIPPTKNHFATFNEQTNLPPDLAQTNKTFCDQKFLSDDVVLHATNKKDDMP